MIVFLSLPSSLLCTQASTLICNYLYFLYTHLGAPTVLSMTMLLMFYFWPKTFFFFRLLAVFFFEMENLALDIALWAWRWKAFVMDLRCSRVSNFVNEFLASTPLRSVLPSTAWKIFLVFHSHSFTFSGNDGERVAGNEIHIWILIKSFNWSFNFWLDRRSVKIFFSFYSYLAFSFPCTFIHPHALISFTPSFI